MLYPRIFEKYRKKSKKLFTNSKVCDIMFFALLNRVDAARRENICLTKYYVHCFPDEEAMEELLSKTPFNLKKDLKEIPEDIIQDIAKEIADELHEHINRPPNLVARYIGRGRKAAWVKIKTLDVQRDAGKSNGYRCITLVDIINRHAYLLHLYRHAHGEDKNISNSEEKALRKLVDEYIESLDKM